MSIVQFGLFKQSRLLVAGALLSLQIMGWGLFINKVHNSPDSKPVAAIRPVANECKNTDKTCQQEQEFRTITEQSGVAGAFSELRAQYAADASVRTNCHPLTHVIGRAAGEKLATVSAAYAEGDEFCWSGYYHGVMEAMLSKTQPDEVVTQINTICNDIQVTKPYSFDHYNCVHGLGHGIMLISHHELFESLEACDNLGNSWERESCYGGVFMENVMAEINPGHSTKYIIADQPLYPCTAVKDTYKQQCYLMQTSQALTSLGGDFTKVFNLCGGIEPQYQATCYQSLGRDASGRSVSNIAQTRQTCLLGQDAVAKSNCIIGAVKDFISYHHSDAQAKDFCSSLDPDLKTICLSTANDYYKTF